MKARGGGGGREVKVGVKVRGELFRGNGFKEAARRRARGERSGLSREIESG